MESTKYVLKNIGIQVPLIDPKTKNYMIIVDNEPLDIPEKLFKTLFIESNEKPKETVKELKLELDPIAQMKEAKAAYGSLEDQIKGLMRLGMSKDAIKETIVETMKKIPELRDMADFASNLIDSI
jgi:hypothetical protein